MPRSKATTETPPATNTEEAAVDVVRVTAQQNIKSWHNYVRNEQRRWDNFWRLYNNIRVKRNYNGLSDTFDPMTHQLVESGVDNVYGSRPQMTFVPTCEHQDTDTKLLNGMWDYGWSKNKMDARIMAIGRESKITGNSASFCEPAEDYMLIRHVPFRDCVFDPTAVDEASLSYGGYERLVLLEDARNEKVYDPTADDGKGGKGAWVNRYTNLDEVPLYKQGTGDPQLDKQIKDCYIGSTLGDDHKPSQILISTMYYADKIVELGNRQTLIANRENPWQKDAYKASVPTYDPADIPATLTEPDAIKQYVADTPVKAADSLSITIDAITGFIPVALNRRYVDPALLIAKGDVEVIADMQELLNDMINAKTDNIANGTKRVTAVDVSNADNEGAVQQMRDAGPGSVIGIIGGREAVGDIPYTDLTTGIDNEIARLKQAMRDAFRMDRVASGLGAEGQGTTATEINAQVAEASGGFQTETRNLESGYYKQLGDIFCAYVQIFVDGKQVVRVLGKDGVEFKDYDSKKFWGLYEANVMLKTRAQAQKQAKGNAVSNLMTVIGANPIYLAAVNVSELLTMAFEANLDMDDDDVKKLLLKGGMPGATPMGPPLPPGAVPGVPALAGAPVGPPMLPMAPAPPLIAPGGRRVA